MRIEDDKDIHKDLYNADYDTFVFYIYIPEVETNLKM